jgi:hypothetical protein
LAAVLVAVGVGGVATGASSADLVALVIGVVWLVVALGLLTEALLAWLNAVDGRLPAVAIDATSPAGFWRAVRWLDARWCSLLDRLRGPMRHGSWLVGGLALAGGVLLLVRADVPAGWAVVLGVLILALAGAVVTNTDLDVIVMVGIVAWGLSLTPEPGVDQVVPEDGAEVLVALGDSYISGEGAPSYFAGTNDPNGNHCRRAPTAYAVALAERGGSTIPDDLLFLACSGAKAAELHSAVQNTDDPPGGPFEVDGEVREGLSQIDALRWYVGEHGHRIQAVVVSIGGNDAQFGKIGPACLAPGDCSQIGQLWLENLANVHAAVGDAFAQLTEALEQLDAEDVPVVVVPYPMPLDEEGCDGVPFTDPEWTFLRGFVGALNDVVAERADLAGFHVVRGMEGVLVRRGMALCGDAEPGVNFVGFSSVDAPLEDRLSPKNWTHNSLHPNPAGHVVMAEVLGEWFARHPGAGRLPEGDETSAGYVPVRLEKVMEDPAFVHCAGSVPPSGCQDDSGRWMAGQLRTGFNEELLPLGILAAGSWLLWLWATLEWRRRRGERAVVPPSGPVLAEDPPGPD